ncbi:MAG: sigma-70 family RNA polymerase sigma factor [Saprospiraceae bacterium]|jgi:RNA polymerase sigma factor (sigma-70 family)|nr:sigma-70 family RNA polymerase sigma factor [Saprospiraceae bacterium]
MIETEIISAIRAGGRIRDQALEQIYTNAKVKNRAKAILVKYNCFDTDFNDIYQDAIILLDKNVRNGQFESRGSLEAYLMSTCKLLWYNELRRKKKFVDEEILKNLENTVTNEVDQTQYDEDLLKLLDLTLKKLDERCRKVLEMWKLSYSMSEIMETLGITSLGMTRKLKFTCLNKLTDLIKCSGIKPIKKRHGQF